MPKIPRLTNGSSLLLCTRHWDSSFQWPAQDKGMKEAEREESCLQKPSVLEVQDTVAWNETPKP